MKGFKITSLLLLLLFLAWLGFSLPPLFHSAARTNYRSAFQRL